MAKEKAKSYTEAELVKMFQLIRIIQYPTALMKNWLAVESPIFTIHEAAFFDEIYQEALLDIINWNEEDLKMKFISFVLRLGELKTNPIFRTFFEKTVSAKVEGHLLSTKTDFMVATGVLDMPEHPYFHFQEYKPHKKPSGDSMAQLLEAMLIGQTINANNKPIYGCEIMGAIWRFVILEGKTYCISESFDCTKKEDLLQIIAILRKFRHILETELLD